ncbi:tungsten formylmethanofuran dehydrogenase [Pseudaminobacter soli (ex Li et al. 2025)]|uniref:Tungsten formylmethanofuran dehydrogenase n=1 Tax=Pseudaminobacter soli (ex Li et al. 2025) TaxID=1295366 RepID=A0A2P7S6W4_9HYPH|nr:tungsten formylmethanofuran dehydrogenase [Mesorhizobium soli]PSJ58212.1 tungsten formylmethanofuran dehydrogenase [Mesorhizobium soli]
MTVAWIGDRGVPLADAAKHAAELLVTSLCPVLSLDTDVHGTRAAIALARRVGAAYDQLDGEAVARETAQYTDKGGMFIAPGEVRRRADVVVIAGELPAVHYDLIAELANTAPDLDGGTGKRQFFLIGTDTPAPGNVKAMRLSCDGGVEATLAALRARLAGRKTAREVTHFNGFAKALAEARFPVFTFCGQSLGLLGLEMVQGLISDINRKQRASALHLAASDNGWGSTQASAWTSGFPLRTGLARGYAEFDPWRFDVARMIADGEADLHLMVACDAAQVPALKGLSLIALAKTDKPVAGAVVTIAIGEPGVDHDAVVYSSRVGTLAAIEAKAPSELPSAAAVLRQITEHLPHEEALPC